MMQQITAEDIFASDHAGQEWSERVGKVDTLRQNQKNQFICSLGISLSEMPFYSEQTIA